jgi:CO/xanthine dehydrogenase FAD-binding subunit
MKAARFDYVRAHSLEQVFALLADADSDPKLIAGGQTLVPLMAMRLAQPEVLVDINDVPGLDTLRVEPDAVIVGATVRQAAALASAEVARHLPLLHAALRHVGHPPTRNRGTVGGSAVTGDPAAEIPLVCTMLDAKLLLGSAAGEREIPAREFYLAPLETAASPQECLLAIRFPRWDASGVRVGCGFEEMAVRHGDFALVAAAAQVAVDAQGRCTRAAAAVTNVAPTIVRADTSALLREGSTDAALDAVCASIEPLLDPPQDLHASAGYRRRLATGLLRRAVTAAWDGACGATAVAS